ncbi:MAG: homoserine kinase [Acidobacteriaceae bacterium]
MQSIRLRLPATSANLGPGFDAVGLAMGLSLTIESHPAETFHIAATGRNADVCARVEKNLILDTYNDVLIRAGKPITPLSLQLQNDIPLGMGCGSSAAALLGGVMLANHFGTLGWNLHQCMEEASRREGHPDNVAACAFGWMTVSCTYSEAEPARVVAATCGQDVPWRLLLALPSASLATEKARALLPAQYTRADAVANVQRTALLVAAFSQGRADLLLTAMQDRMHQPYRMDACPLLRRLIPLAGTPGILGVALSGAGPGVLLLSAHDFKCADLTSRIREAAGDPGLEVVETYAGPGVSQRECPIR